MSPTRPHGSRSASGSSEFGIFDVFPDDSGRQAHLAGGVADAPIAQAPDLLAKDPVNEQIDVLAVGTVTTANIAVRVTGRRAVADYALESKAGKVLGREKGDVYVKAGGRWLDEEARCA